MHVVMLHMFANVNVMGQVYMGVLLMYGNNETKEVFM